MYINPFVAGCVVTVMVEIIIIIGISIYMYKKGNKK